MQITVQMLATGQTTDGKDESSSHLNVSDPGRDAVGIIETVFFSELGFMVRV